MIIWIHGPTYYLLNKRSILGLSGSKGISLKFPRWFIKWFVNFGPLTSIFPTKINEVYSYFRQNSTFVPGYRLIYFIVSQAITWIVVWDYTFVQPYEGVKFKILSRKIKIKWWKKFNNKLVCKNKIQ